MIKQPVVEVCVRQAILRTSYFGLGQLSTVDLPWLSQDFEIHYIHVSKFHGSSSQFALQTFIEKLPWSFQPSHAYFKHET